MGSRTTRQERLQRARKLLSSPPYPYPPIYLSPSISFDPFSPSPSPLPAAAAGGHHNSVPTATIVGSGIAGAVAIATTATVIAAVAGKVSLGCLLGPLFKVLACLCQRFLDPCTDKLKSLCNSLSKWNPLSRRHTSGDDAVKSDHTELYEILGGSPAKSESATAVAHSLSVSPLRDIVEGHVKQLQTSANTYIVTSVSNYAEAQVKKQKEMILQPVCENTAKAQGYAESFLSITDSVSDDLLSLKKSADAHLNEVAKLKANAIHAKASGETVLEVWKEQGDAALTMFEGAIGGWAEKAKNAAANENKAMVERLEKLEALVTVEEEVVLHRKRGKARIGSNRGAHESEEDQDAQQRVLANEGAKRIGPVCIVESASDANAQLQAAEEEIAPSSHKHDSGGAASHTSKMALLPTDHTGGNVKGSARAASMVPVPTKANMAIGREKASAGKEFVAPLSKGGDGMRKGKRKRESNMGHVSFSCEMSALRFHFFTMCKSGGTYGSPPTSPSHHPHYHPTYHHRNNNNSPPHHNSSHNPPPSFILMHQQYQPSPHSSPYPLLPSSSQP